MKSFLTIAVMIATLNSAFALEVYGLKKSGSSLTVVTADSFNKAWTSQEMVCIKDGGKFLGGNKAYGSKTSGGKACASTDAANRMNKIKFGSLVTVFRLAELPESVIKELSKN